MHLFRVILPVSDIEHATRFYSALLNIPGHRVSPGRHYFNCGGTILACFDPHADGHRVTPRSNPEHIYFAVPDLESVFQRAQKLDCLELEASIKSRPWGERSFYAKDPFNNP